LGCPQPTSSAAPSVIAIPPANPARAPPIPKTFGFGASASRWVGCRLVTACAFIVLLLLLFRYTFMVRCCVFDAIIVAGTSSDIVTK
jgi:hypothetical protein